MNLYAILPAYSPGNGVKLMLAENDTEALDHAVYEAARDACKGYQSTRAEVYLVAADLKPRPGGTLTT